MEVVDVDLGVDAKKFTEGYGGSRHHVKLVATYEHFVQNWNQTFALHQTRTITYNNVLENREVPLYNEYPFRTPARKGPGTGEKFSS